MRAYTQSSGSISIRPLSNSLKRTEGDRGISERKQTQTRERYQRGSERERGRERNRRERERERIYIERIVDTEQNLKPVEKSKRIVKLFKNARHALLLGLEVGKRPPHAFCLHVPVLVDRDLEHLERRRLSPQDQLAASA